MMGNCDSRGSMVGIGSHGGSMVGIGGHGGMGIGMGQSGLGNNVGVVVSHNWGSLDLLDDRFT